MILRYAISEHTLSAGDSELYGEVWVALRNGDDGLHVIDEVIQADERPQDAERIWVKASAHGGYAPPGTPGRLELVYGIERLFVPEGRGTPRFDRLEVEGELLLHPSARFQAHCDHGIPRVVLFDHTILWELRFERREHSLAPEIIGVVKFPGISRRLQGLK